MEEEYEKLDWKMKIDRRELLERRDENELVSIGTRVNLPTNCLDGYALGSQICQVRMKLDALRISAINVI